MEFSDDVLKGLSYIANGSYLSEDNFKKIVNSSLGLLSGEPVVERVSSICPEKGDIIKQVYASLLTFTVEAVQNSSDDDIKNFLSKQNIKKDRIDYYLKIYNSNKENIVQSLENCQSDWPRIVDAGWRLDFIVKSNTRNHIGDSMYYIILTTEKNGNLEHIKFTCDLHQLQDFSTTLKEIVCHLEKISST